MKYIPLDALVAEIKKRKREAENNCGGHKSLREHECDRCQVDKYEDFEEIINTLEAKEVDLELITEWFDHIAQIANDRKTANGKVMKDWAALDEIKCLARESSEFIRTHCNAQKEVVHIIDEETGNLYDVEIDKTKVQKGE